MTITATYSPEDNKIRLYASSRLDAETYARVKAAGFSWAPKQGLFVAPMWTPERADLAEELAGEIGDEDTSLVQRAEERAERFEGYHERRAEDAEAAREAVERITSGIPTGQPILVGHHSERHARKDAERIENGMRRAVKMWETAQYWQERARGAIGAAKYKERPDVRARRIKGLEADERKMMKDRDGYAQRLRLWTSVHDDEATTLRRKDGQPSTFLDRALHLANGGHTGLGYGLWSDLTDGKITPAEAQARVLAALPSLIARCERWLAHLAGRLAYERAMLAESGGTVAQRTGPEKGGAVKCWASPRGGWSYIQKVNRVSVTVLDNWGNGGRNFTRTIPFDKLSGVMTAAEVAEAREAGRLVETADGTGFMLADGPKPPTPPSQPETTPLGEPFAAMKDTLRAGVRVVTAPQLFPTPADLARRMVEAGDVQPGHRVLEPSAGTGRLVSAIISRGFLGLECGGAVVAVEVNAELCRGLEEQRRKTLHANDSNYAVRCSDFLSCDGDLGTFDRIVMNPPFHNAQDVKHIEHARKLLKPGGRLVALCAAGPRQEAALRPVASSWEVLPDGTFEAEGTGVRVALLTIEG